MHINDDVKVKRCLNIDRHNGEIGKIENFYPDSHMFGAYVEVRLRSGCLVDCHLEDLEKVKNVCI